MRDDKTTMGGAEERFQTTCWTEMLEARTLDEARRRERVDELLKKYWKPVYCYLRRKGHSNDFAKDMTQDFFYEVVLGRELIQRADKTKGRFRTFLLTALDRYASDIYHKETAKKRLAKSQQIPLETADPTTLTGTKPDLRPDQVFHHMWASQVLNQVLDSMKTDCHNSGKSIHWEVFNAKVIRPILDDTEPPSLKELCAKHGIDSERKASDMIYLLKRQFRTAMRRFLRQFVESDSEVDDEFNEILEILSKSSTR
jgi:DNA-directed RNA polymerase specialized sigma24 family protein